MPKNPYKSLSTLQKPEKKFNPHNSNTARMTTLLLQ